MTFEIQHVIYVDLDNFYLRLHSNEKNKYLPNRRSQKVDNETQIYFANIDFMSYKIMLHFN